MSRLEDLVREALAEHVDQAPDDATLLSVVRGRAVRWHRRRRLTAVLTVAVALVAGGVAGRELVASHGDSATIGSSNGTPPTADSTEPVVLVTSGACVGLSVTAVKPPTTRDGPTTTLARIRPGSVGNFLTMPGNSMIWLQAQGPCVAQLRFHPDGYFLQGPQPTGDANFSSYGLEGIGPIVSHDHTGRTRVDLYLDCAGATGCTTNTPPLAAITVDVTAPVAPPTTLMPASSP